MKGILPVRITGLGHVPARGGRSAGARRAFAALGVVLALACLCCQTDSVFDTYDSLRDTFADPPAEYRSAPFWVWNDRMTREEIRAGLSDFREKGIGGVFIHPRPGLITPYLSEEWLSLCKFAVETGKSLGLKVWLYDENSYPSGFAGGHVPARMPDAVRSSLKMTRIERPFPEFDSPPLIVLRRTLTGFEEVALDSESLPDDQAGYYAFEVVKEGPSPWFGGFAYVDLMRRDVTETFLDITLEAYRRTVGEEFGRTVPGVFQDEAGIAPTGGPETVSYTPALFQAFQDKWDYDLKAHLPSLFDDVGDWRRVRHNYYSVLLDLFVENWAKPYYDYCTENDLIFTGHYWEHTWPSPRIVPDNLALAAYAHMPGIDILMNEWGTGPHAQFGSARAVREIRSAANQSGRRRTLSETYGAAGWDLTFLDQKRIGDWEFALGINFLNQHLSFVTVKGARKRDHPLSFSYHEPWWSAYRLMADYFGRLSLVLSSGEQVNRILVLEPTSSAWMFSTAGPADERLKRIGSDFQTFIHLLEAEQIEYDVASEKTIEETAKIRRGKFVVGRRAYDLLVFPPGLENLNGPTFELLKDYLFRGGKIVSWVAPPDYLDGSPTDAVRVLAGSYSDRWVDSGQESGFDRIRFYSPPRLVFEDLRESSSLFHYRAEFRDCEFVFLANVGEDRSAGGAFHIEGGAVEEWEALSGRVEPYPFERDEDALKVEFSIPPGDSLLLCVRPDPADPPPISRFFRGEIKPAGDLKIEREEPNVLTLDYCDLTIGGETERDLYFYEAQERTFRFHGLGGNPWDRAVQFKTNILDLDNFPPDSGFEAAFRFNAEGGGYLSSLQAVVERPDIFDVEINGTGIRALPDQWWLDKAFGIYPVGPFVRAGENTIVVKTRPFSIHAELESIYILGDFRLEGAARGFVVVPPAPLRLGPWSEQGLPFYPSGVAYRKDYDIPETGEGENRYTIELENWGGAVAEVRVNGERAGLIAFPPYALDITEALRPGRAVVTVSVLGTLRNTLGPHHNRPPLGKAWPGSFQKGSAGGLPEGEAYDFVPYGLFIDFKLVRHRMDKN